MCFSFYWTNVISGNILKTVLNLIFGLVKKMDAYHLQYTLDEDIKFEEKNVQNY